MSRERKVGFCTQAFFAWRLLTFSEEQHIFKLAAGIILLVRA